MDRVYDSDMITEFLKLNEPTICNDGESGIFTDTCCKCKNKMRQKSLDSCNRFGNSDGYVHGVFMGDKICYFCRKVLIKMSKNTAIEIFKECTDS